MSAQKIWYPNESVVPELPAAQPISGSDAASKNGMEASNGNGAGATLAKGKPKITRRRIPTVDTNTLRNDCTSSDEKLDTDQCGRGMASTTYSTIEDTGSRASTNTLLSNLMQHAEPVLSKDTNFHGWLHNDPLLQWRNIFLPKMEHPTSKNARDNKRTRRHRSEEFVFQHYKDTSEYMKYYRKHCCLTSLSVPSLSQHQRPKAKEKSTGKQAKRPSTKGVFRTIDSDSGRDNQEHGSTDPQNSKLAGLENRLNLTASVLPPSKSMPIVPKPTPPSIVNRESTSIVLCGSGSNSSEKYYKDDNDSLTVKDKETAVKSAGEGVELPPINNTYHSSSDSHLHVKQYQRATLPLTDPHVGAEGEIEFHSEMDNASDPTLATTTSVSLIQQPTKSSTKLTQHGEDENVSSATDDSWIYPYPHFQVPSSFNDKITREQLLSSKAHALGLVSSKNWIKSKKGDISLSSDTSLLTRIKSSPGRIPKELHGNGTFVPTLEGVNEKPNFGKMKVTCSKANYVTDTVHDRLKTAESHGHTQSRPLHTSQGSRPHHQRTTSGARYKQCPVPPASKISFHKKQLANIYHNRQLSGYVGQVSERLQGILKVKHKNSTFIQKSNTVAS